MVLARGSSVMMALEWQLSTDEQSENRRQLMRLYVELGRWNVRTMLTAFPLTLTSSPTQKFLRHKDEVKRLKSTFNTASLRWHTEREILHILLTGEEHWWVTREWDRPCSEKQRVGEVQPGSKGSEWFLVSLLNTAESPVTSAIVYASKRSTRLDGKNEFYENLAAIIGSIPRKEQIILLADFNAWVGTYHDFWPSWLGQFRNRKKER